MTTPRARIRQHISLPMNTTSSAQEEFMSPANQKKVVEVKNTELFIKMPSEVPLLVTMDTICAVRHDKNQFKL